MKLSVTGIKTLIDQSVTILSPSFKLFAPALTIVGSMSIGFCVVTNEISENREHIDTLSTQVSNVEISIQNNINNSTRKIESFTTTETGIDVTAITVSILNRLDLLVDELQREPGGTEAIVETIVVTETEIVEIEVPVIITQTVVEIVEVPVFDADAIADLREYVITVAEGQAEAIDILIFLSDEIARLSDLHPDVRVTETIRRLTIVERDLRDHLAQKFPEVITEIIEVSNITIVEVTEVVGVPPEVLDVVCQDASTPPHGGPHAVDAGEVCE
jgi:hypothetical protein